MYNTKFEKDKLKEVFEDKSILKCGYQIKDDYILLKQVGIKPQNMMFDAKIAMYLLNSGTNLYSIEEVAKQHLNLELEDYYNKEKENDNVQTSFFDNELQENEEKINYKYSMYSLLDDKKSGNMNCKYILQRKPFQWTQEERNRYICRLLSNLPIPEIILCEQNIKGMNIAHLIDGLQRLSYAEAFKENRFKI